MGLSTRNVSTKINDFENKKMYLKWIKENQTHIPLTVCITLNGKKIKRLQKNIHYTCVLMFFDEIDYRQIGKVIESFPSIPSILVTHTTPNVDACFKLGITEILPVRIPAWPSLLVMVNWATRRHILDGEKFTLNEICTRDFSGVPAISIHTPIDYESMKTFNGGYYADVFRDHEGSILKRINKQHSFSIETLANINTETICLRKQGMFLDILHSQQYITVKMRDMGNSLEEYISSNSVSISDRLSIFCKLAEKVETLHGNSIYHRDLKPANICIDTDKRINIIDFGLSSFTRTRNELCGTEPFTAPEVYNEPYYDCLAADWFSVGIILIELLTESCIIEKHSTAKNVYEAMPHIKEHSDPKYHKLITRLTAADPKKRWRLRHVKKDPDYSGLFVESVISDKASS